MHDDRKVTGAAPETDRGAARPPAPRSGWFDDETLEIEAPEANAGQVGVRPLSKALGVGVSELPPIFREVYLDNRGEAEPKLEGSWRRARLFWKTDRWKKLLKG